MPAFNIFVSVTLSLTMDIEESDQPAHGFSQEGWTQVLIACRHSEILVGREWGDRLNVGAARNQLALISDHEPYDSGVALSDGRGICGDST